MTFHADEYKAAAGRYEAGMPYRRVGRSGLDLPAISLGLWHNFGDDVPIERQQATLRRAFDRGVTHFDLANNYGPPYGSAERNFGTHLRARLPALPRRAGHLEQGGLRHVARPLRPGRRLAQVPHRLVRPVPAADGPGLRRHLLQPPLRRDDAARGDAWARSTPSSARARRSTSASRRTPAARTREAVEILRSMGTPLLIHQPSYSMLNRWIERGPARRRSARPGLGLIAFSPLAQGMLTNKYLKGIPEGSRAAQGKSLDPSLLTEASLQHVRALDGWRRRAASRSRRWRWPGRCATSGSRRCSSARRPWSSSTTAWMPCKNLDFSAEELADDRRARRRRRHQPVEDLERRVSCPDGLRRHRDVPTDPPPGDPMSDTEYLPSPPAGCAGRSRRSRRPATPGRCTS